MTFDKRVDPTRVSFEEGAISGREALHRFASGGAQPKDPLLAITLEKSGTGDFSHFSGSKASHDVHLPEAVLRRDVALGEKEVVETFRANRRDATGVADDCHRRRESAHGKSTVELRKRGAGNGIQVSHCTCQNQEKADRDD